MQPERIVTVAAMRGEFGRLVRGLEVEGWSIEELREALGIMSECIRAADAEGCARGSAGSPMRTEGCRHGPRIATRGRRKPCGGYGRGLRLRGRSEMAWSIDLFATAAEL